MLCSQSSSARDRSSCAWGGGSGDRGGDDADDDGDDEVLETETGDSDRKTSRRPQGPAWGQLSETPRPWAPLPWPGRPQPAQPRSNLQGRRPPDPWPPRRRVGFPSRPQQTGPIRLGRGPDFNYSPGPPLARQAVARRDAHRATDCESRAHWSLSSFWAGTAP